MRLSLRFVLPFLLLAASPAERLSAAMAAFDAHHDRAAAAGFRTLSNEDSAIGETMLGVMYASGRIGASDRATAAGFWLRAAMRGYPPAALALARARAQGSGVRRNPQDAYYWALIAARRGEGATRAAAQSLVDTLVTRLSADDRADIAAKARTWRP